jgi:hypothetical protein
MLVTWADPLRYGVLVDAFGSGAIIALREVLRERTNEYLYTPRTAHRYTNSPTNL